MDAKLSRFFHRILLWTPRLFDAVERGHASSEYPLGVRRLPDGTRVRLKLVAERVDGRADGRRGGGRRVAVVNGATRPRGEP